MSTPNADSEALDPTTKLLYSTMDARVWAQEWCRIAREIEASNDGREIIDEGWMIGWFANAIMMGWDEHARRYPPPPKASVDDHQTNEGRQLMADYVAGESYAAKDVPGAEQHLTHGGLRCGGRHPTFLSFRCNGCDESIYVPRSQNDGSE